MSNPLNLEGPLLSVFNFHHLFTTVLWCGPATIGIFFPLFPQYKILVELHGIIMWLVVGLSFTAIAPPMIVRDGIVSDGIVRIHEITGLIVLFEMGIICILGRLLKIKKQSTITSPKTIEILKKMHVALGFVLYLTAQIAMIEKWSIVNLTVCYALAGYQSFVVVAWILVNVFTAKISTKENDEEIGDVKIEELRKINKQNDLLIYSNNYFVFADYVFSLSKVLHSHPGGIKIIEAIRGRQVDRFLYGGQPLEILAGEHNRFEHSKRALNLAGPPLAKFERYNPYPSMSDSNECVVESLRELNKASSVYLLQLSSKGAQFQYAGFQSVSQLGQYFTVTINDRKTRLYTSVNCMSTSNRHLMAEIAEEMNDNFGKINESQDTQSEENSVKTNRSLKKLSKKDRTVPLLIKRYNDGEFTSQFISEKFQGTIRMSRSMGAGLALQEKKPGKIIILAGGTGIYPFIDTIDILYKRYLVSINHEKKQKILLLNPRITAECFQKFTFSFVVSFKSLKDLHPLTIYQINQLGRYMKDRFTCSIKISETLEQRYKGLKLTNERFEVYLEKELSEEKMKEISHIYMCGPTKMTSAILHKLDEYQIDSSRYTII